jgi:hypothetical protein
MIHALAILCFILWLPVLGLMLLMALPLIAIALTARGVFSRYAMNVYVSIDHVASALLGGDPQSTLSGRFGWCVKNSGNDLCRCICKALSWIDHRHCERIDEHESEAMHSDTEIIKFGRHW